jgi:hypothetical protein
VEGGTRPIPTLANLKGEDVDWTHGTVSFTRKKTGVPALVRLGGKALNLLISSPL